MKTFFAIFSLMLAAQAVRAGDEDVVTADRLTCDQLRRVAVRDRIYWKMSPDDGPIPIYGFYTYKQFGGTGGGCDHEKHKAGVYERTLDEPRCLAVYYCG